MNIIIGKHKKRQMCNVSLWRSISNYLESNGRGFLCFRSDVEEVFAKFEEDLHELEDIYEKVELHTFTSSSSLVPVAIDCTISNYEDDPNRNADYNTNSNTDNNDDDIHIMTNLLTKVMTERENYVRRKNGTVYYSMYKTR